MNVNQTLTGCGVKMSSPGREMRSRGEKTRGKKIKKKKTRTLSSSVSVFDVIKDSVMTPWETLYAHATWLNLEAISWITLGTYLRACKTVVINNRRSESLRVLCQPGESKTEQDLRDVQPSHRIRADLAGQTRCFWPQCCSRQAVGKMPEDVWIRLDVTLNGITLRCVLSWAFVCYWLRVELDKPLGWTVQ